jgi:hypothetical protein
LNEIGCHTGAQQFGPSVLKFRIAAGVNTVSQRHDRAASTQFLARRFTENFICYTFERVVERRPIARPQVFDSSAKGLPVIGEFREYLDLCNQSSSRTARIETNNRDAITWP